MTEQEISEAYKPRYYTRGHEQRVRCNVDYWSNEVIRDPGNYQGKHRISELKCICAGQGRSVYSSGCPRHDHTVDTSNPLWRRWYEDRIDAQRLVRERLGW